MEVGENMRRKGNRSIFLLVFAFVILSCEPLQYSFYLNFHFISNELSYTPSNVSIEIQTKKQTVAIDSTMFTVCPDCEKRFLFEDVPGYLQKTPMTDFFEFYSDETPIKIEVNVFDSTSANVGQLAFVIEKSYATYSHACLLYFAPSYNENNSLLKEFYDVAISKRTDTLIVQSAPINECQDSLYFVYVN